MTSKKDKSFAKNMSILATILSLLGCCAAYSSLFIPTWLYISQIPQMFWNKRNIGLFRLSHQFTDLREYWADITWQQTISEVCAIGFSAGMGSQGLSSLAKSQVLGALGANCGDACKANADLRCSRYKIMKLLGFYCAGALVLGGGSTVAFATYSFFLKEKTKDKHFNFWMMIVGCLVAASGPAVWILVWIKTHNELNSEGNWYPSYSFGFSFFIACLACVLFFLSTLPQLAKYLRAKKEKKAVDDKFAVEQMVFDQTMVDLLRDSPERPKRPHHG